MYGTDMEQIVALFRSFAADMKPQPNDTLCAMARFSTEAQS
jgi:hypothetical protein